MTTRRWCLSCFDDFAEDTSLAGLCMACDYEHDRTVRLSRHSFHYHNDDMAEWWGPTLNAINGEDIAEGFYVTSIGIPEEFDDEEDEQWAVI